MPRRQGLDKSTFFHVWNRGADRQDIFAGAPDQAFFESLMSDAVERSGVRLHAYSLMNNHFHMIIEAIGEQLSICMYHVGRAYAVWFNHEGGRTGPVFDGRFGSQPITDDVMLMVEGRYVHRNPVDIIGLDGLVDYRFSSLGVYAGLRPRPNWLSTDVLASPFSDSDAFVRYVRRTLVSDTQYSGRRPPLVRTQLQDLDQAVQTVTGTTWAALRRSSRGIQNEARIVAVTLATELRLGSSAELARWFEFPSERAVRNCSAKGRMLIARERSFAGLRRRVLDRLLIEAERPAA